MKKTLSMILSIIILMTSFLTSNFAYAATLSEKENNNDIAFANNLPVNQAIRGSLSSDNDKDYFKFTLSDAGKTTITFNTALKNTSCNWYVDLFDENYSYSSTKFYQNDTDNTSIAVGLPAGTYYIKVYCYSYYYYSSDEYNLTLNYENRNDWEKEDNDGSAFATALTPNKKTHGGLSNSDDEDYYVFTLPKAGKTTITFNTVLKNTSCNWYVDLFDENYSYSSTKFYQNDTDNTSIAVGLPAGTYYIKVYCYSYYYYSSDEYNLTLNYENRNDWEKENNDITSFATKLNLNSKMYGSLNGSNDEDYYKITLPCSGKVSITFNTKAINTQCYWNILLFSEKTQKDYIDDKYYQSKGTGKSNTINLTAGTYYLKVSSNNYYYSSSNTYGITVNFSVSAPSKLSVSTRNTTSIKLSWNKVSGASGYEIQKKSGSSYKKITSTTSTIHTIKNLSSATSYTFRVRAYKTIDGKKYYSSWKTITTPTKPAKVSIKTPATNKRHQIIAKWNTVARASGYQVQYCKNKSCSNVIATKTVKGQSKNSYTGNNFTKGRTYYVRIRAYKTVNGKKYYGSWSSVKSIKSK